MAESTEPDEEPAAPAAPARDYGVAYAAALAPKPKIGEMVAVLDYFAVQHNGSALAVSKLNGGEFDMEMLRRVAVLDAARDLLMRVREKAPSWPENVQKIIKGPSSRGEYRGR